MSDTIYTNSYFTEIMKDWVMPDDFYDDSNCEPFDPSESYSGENNSFYGKKHTEETKQFLSQRQMGKNNPMYGRKRGKECSNGMDVSGDKNPMYGKGHLIKGKTQNKRLTCPLCGMESNSTNIKRHITKTHKRDWREVLDGTTRF